jgi:predicted DNA-binding protein (UPF0251 family)
MKVDDILDENSLDREIASQYIDAITRSNQSEAADEIGVSRQTIQRYKTAFNDMTQRERALVITNLSYENLTETSQDH